MILVSPELLQAVLGGTLLTSLGAGVKYLIDTHRTTSRERSPLGIAASASAAADAAITTMSKVNDELSEANARLLDENVRMAKANGCLREALQEVTQREARLRAEVSSLESRVREHEFPDPA